MKNIYYFFFLSVFSGFSQTVSVDNTSLSPDEMVNFLLNNACVQVSNISISSHLAVASFDGNNSDFPLENGLIIRSGNATFSEGSYTGDNLSSELNTNTDQDLQDIVNNSGQTSEITDVAYLEFDFIPISNSFSFDFLFASNEYGDYQCISNDALAFLLTNLNTGETQNLATINNSAIPVSVKNIRDAQYNTSCVSENPQLFDVYNVDNPTSYLNMNGHTVVMNASSDLVIGDPYRIRFVIGDSNDSDFDSAIFLAAGSFETNLDLGEGRKLCIDETVELNTFLDASIYTHQWSVNDEVIANETGNTFMVDGAGTYQVIVTNNDGSCDVIDEITFEQFYIEPPTDIPLCFRPGNYEINLIEKKSEILGGQNADDFTINYYNSLANAQNEEAPITSLFYYLVPSGFESETIWVRVNDTTGSGCFTIVSFELIEHPLPDVSTVEDAVVCTEYVFPSIENGTYSGPGTTDEVYNPGDVTTESGTYYINTEPDENGCYNTSAFTVTVIESFEMLGYACGEFLVPEPPWGDFYTDYDGPNGTGEIIPVGTSFEEDVTLYYYAEIDGVICRNDAIEIDVLPAPELEVYGNIVACGSYILPPLPLGDYFTQASGGGVQLPEGTVIEESQSLYVYAEEGICDDEDQFFVKIVPIFDDVNVCGSYTLEELPSGVYYYTEPLGGGDEIEEATEIFTSQTIYVYSSLPGVQDNCVDYLSFEVNVNNSPPIDELPDAPLACPEDSYMLPELTNGNYFTAPEGEGTQLFAGDIITSPQTIYIYLEENDCSAETFFEVVDDPLPDIENFTDVYSCDPYVLPTPLNGNFFTEPNGNGEMLMGGDTIDQTQTIYIYNEAGGNSPCFNEKVFTVYIVGVEVDELEDVNACGNFELPSLQVGNYYTESGGEGTQLFAGDVITENQEVYIYILVGDRIDCISESSFTVTISESPILPDFEDIESCGSYALPQLNQNNYNVGYYLSPNGQDEVQTDSFTPGEYTIYVYATALTNDFCVDEKQFQLTVYPLLDFFVDEGTICIDIETGELISSHVLQSGLDPNEFLVEWFLNNTWVHTGPNYEAVEGGEYSIVTTKLTPEVGANCNYNATSVNVNVSSQPIIDVHVSEDFSESPSIRVEVIEGSGDYLYQLDDGVFQQNNQFYNVSAGTHTINVKSKDGFCGLATAQAHVLTYPKFFTPNNDGFNDTWSIKDLGYDPEAVVYIFDRFGKLLKAFSPSRDNWDGTYNNSNMPSNDYWFKVNYHNKEGGEEEFVSHFTLKR